MKLSFAQTLDSEGFFTLNFTEIWIQHTAVHFMRNGISQTRWPAITWMATGASAASPPSGLSSVGPGDTSQKIYCQFLYSS